MNKNKLFLLLFGGCFLIGGLLFLRLVIELNGRINNSFEKGWISPPIEYYTAPEELKLEQALSLRQITNKLKKRYYIRTTKDLKPGYFKTEKAAACVSKKSGGSCLFWRDVDTGDEYNLHILEGKIVELQKNNRLVDSILLAPFLFAQYEGQEPVLRKFKPLNEFPFYCLQSVLNAEDHRFITHEGISPQGIMRAMWRNVRAGRLAEGGSTITQQLVKNVFFSHEKTFWRKFQEQIMALILETKLSKDEILVAYLNVVYMGQSGVFRIHGFGSAAEHYFGKPLSLLSLSECAFLAGIIKSPGRYKPSEENEQIVKRRNYIITTLEKKNIINEAESLLAQGQKIQTNIQESQKNLPVYFTDSVYREIKEQGWPTEEGLKVFTTLHLDRQIQAQKASKQGLDWLEKKRIKNKEGLQVALINVDVATGEVRAIIGGRDFRKSQFNRVQQARRQIGSLMKPVVMLTALIEDSSLQPLSKVKDEVFTHKYGLGQTWSPKNYKETYMGEVPLYKILTHSLNAGMAQVGIKVGLEKVVKTVEQLGGPKNIKAHPSLALGAVEMSPWEVAQMFLTLANLGTYRKQHLIKKVSFLNDELIYEHKPVAEQRLSDNKTAVVLGMLKEVCKSGTAKWLKDMPIALAGKTGTTNEERDAWFVGFTPETLSLVWVGFDDNQSLELTGAGAALPIWEFFMRRTLASLSKEDFAWPKDTEIRTIQATEMIQDPETIQGPKKETKRTFKVHLIFEK